MASFTSQTQKALVYGTISTLIVSLLSLSGACIIPLLKGKAKHRWMHFFVAMAVATLSSDAILHIIPELANAHVHGQDENDHSHDHHLGHHDHHSIICHENVTQKANASLSDHDHLHEHEHKLDPTHHHNDEHEHRNETTDSDTPNWLRLTEERRVLLRLSAILLLIYFLYFLEFVCYYRRRHVCSQRKAITSNPKEAIITHCNETLTNHAWTEQHSCPVRSNEALVTPKSASDSESLDDDNDKTIVIWGLTSRALVILVGDGLHNFVDGVAIGASFCHSDRLGVVTAIAVVCHELPHELGDLAVLLDSGLSMVKALALNLLSALTAFIGLYVSIAFGEWEETQMWLLAISCGMFLYVAWIDMLAHLKHDGAHMDHWSISVLLQYSGFTVGFLSLFLLGWFEDDIYAS